MGAHTTCCTYLRQPDTPYTQYSHSPTFSSSVSPCFQATCQPLAPNSPTSSSVRSFSPASAFRFFPFSVHPIISVSPLSSPRPGGQPRRVRPPNSGPRPESTFRMNSSHVRSECSHLLSHSAPSTREKRARMHVLSSTCLSPLCRVWSSLYLIKGVSG